MPPKDFEQPVIKFQQVKDQSGNVIASFPIVNISLVPPQGLPSIKLPLLFDTGASLTTLGSDLFPLLGLRAWDEGQPIQSDTASGLATGYLYTATLEVFGKIITCPIQLIQKKFGPLYLGLLGRQTVFNAFGFGFWESTQELFVTNNP